MFKEIYFSIWLCEICFVAATCWITRALIKIVQLRYNRILLYITFIWYIICQITQESEIPKGASWRLSQNVGRCTAGVVCQVSSLSICWLLVVSWLFLHTLPSGSFDPILRKNWGAVRKLCKDNKWPMALGGNSFILSLSEENLKWTRLRT